MNRITGRIPVIAASTTALLGGVMAVVTRYIIDGSGDYGSIFFLFAVLAVGSLVLAVDSITQFSRGKRKAVYPLATSAIALAVLMLLAFAVGLRG